MGVLERLKKLNPFNFKGFSPLPTLNQAVITVRQPHSPLPEFDDLFPHFRRLIH